MAMCIVSVIIPVYNSAHTILRAINSVLNQTFVDYEVIIIDDGSTDNTKELIANIKEVNYSYQNNMGASSARNHGAHLAKGKLLAFLDADDAWHPQKLELQVAAFSKYSHIGACYTSRIHLKAGDSLPPFAQYDNPTIIIHTSVTEIFECPFLGTPSVMMPLTIFKELNGFDETLSTAEDADLWLRTANRYNIACIDAPLTVVFRSKNSLRSFNINNTYRNNIVVIDKFCNENSDFVSNHGKMVRDSKAKVYEQWGSSLLAVGQTKREIADARRYFLQSLFLRLTLRPIYLLIRSFIPLEKKHFRISTK